MRFIGNKISDEIMTFNYILIVFAMPLPNFMSKTPDVRPPAREVCGIKAFVL